MNKHHTTKNKRYLNRRLFKTKERIMLRPIAFTLVYALLAPQILAGEVPGTSATLTPPDGFVEATRFPGFIKESTGSSIMISEIPGPYAEVTAG